jgi:hypothetical protein
MHYCGDGNDLSMFETDIRTDFALKGSRPILDLKALIDFFVCRGIDTFNGNSVSTFSVLQIASRHGVSNWYNSQSIP